MDKTKLTAGLFILLATIGTTYFITIDDPVYYCEDLDVVGICHKLSKVNAEGLQTRCYYDLNNTRKYKNCKSGWIEYNKTEFIGDKINLTEEGFDVNFSTDKKVILNKLGIKTPKIRPCIKIDDYTCRANIHDEGIKKQITVTYNSCNNWSKLPENATANQTQNFKSECISWNTLNQFEIQKKLNEKADELFNQIVKVQIQRNKLKETEFLTGEISLNI